MPLKEKMILKDQQELENYRRNLLYQQREERRKKFAESGSRYVAGSSPLPKPKPLTQIEADAERKRRKAAQAKALEE